MAINSRRRGRENGQGSHMEINHIGDFEIIPKLVEKLHYAKVKADDGALIMLNMDNIKYIDVESCCVEMGDTFIELDAKSMQKLCDLLGMDALDLC